MANTDVVRFDVTAASPRAIRSSNVLAWTGATVVMNVQIDSYEDFGPLYTSQVVAGGTEAGMLFFADGRLTVFDNAFTFTNVWNDTYAGRAWVAWREE